MELSIEEAWEDHDEALLCVQRGQACHPPDEAWKDAEDAARALALAVLDDEHSTLRRCNCITWAEGDRCRDYKASRARIEALGKEG